MAAYHKVEVSLGTNAVTVGIPSPQEVRVVLPLIGPVGPQGATGPAGPPGEVSGSIAWDNVSGKPSTFAPSTHTHVAANITDFTTAVAAVSPPVDWASLTGKPSTFTPAAHTHPISDVTNLQTALDGKAATSHTHTASAISDSTTAGRALLTGADAAAQRAILNVADGATANATNAQLRDRSTHTGTQAASTISDFNTAAAAAAPVQSVAGRTGAVTLAVADVSGAVSTSDSRLSDARTPSSTLAHASTHHTGGTDAIAPNQISAAWALVLSNQTITGNTLLAAGRNRRITLFAVGATANVDLPHDNNQAGDVVTLVADWSVASTLTVRTASVMSGSTPLAYSTLATLNASGQSFTLVSNGTATGWTLRAVDTHTHASTQITGLAASATTDTTNALNISSGTLATARLSVGTTAGTVAAGDDARLSDARTPTAHAHGNISNTGTIGTDSGLPVVTTTAGAVTTLALGTANQVLRVNSGATAVEFADPSGGGSGGTKTYAVFTAEHNQPPSTAFATLDTRNSIAVLDFSDTATEGAVFVGIMPEAATLTSGLIVRLHWMATSATSGNVRWSVAFERSNTDLDADSFDTATAATATTNGTSGIVTVTAITCTNIDSIAAGDLFRLRVQRLGADAADTMTGAKGCELVAVEVRGAA